MLHIQFNPMARRPAVEELRKTASASEDGWLEAVLIWDRVTNNYYEKDASERGWIRAVTRLLEGETIPEKYRTGVHLLHAQRSWMGEDICIQDGHLLTTIHAKHETCGKYQLVCWDKTFCVHCQRLVPKSEIVYAGE